MDEQTRLWIFGGLFVLIGAVFLVRSFLLSGKFVRVVILASGVVLLIAGCAELYFAFTFQERKAKARAQRDQYDQMSRDMDRRSQEQAEEELRARVPVLGGRSAGGDQAHNQQVDGTRP
jgi:O-antigen ligase